MSLSDDDDDDDDMVAEYWSDCYLLNSRELNFRIRRSSRRKSPYAGSLSVKQHKFAVLNVHENCMFKYKYEYKYFKTVLEYKYKCQVCIWGYNDIYH